MFRGVRWVLGVMLLAALLASESQAQYGRYYPRGYGGYGWGGWGGTVQGSIARGMGYYAMGAGVYNRQTAVANAINTNTVMQWNQFMFQSQMQANQREHARMAARLKRDSMTGDLIYQRLRDNPTPEDVNDGDALNVVLDQMTDPKVIHGSTLRLVTAPVTSAAVADIPFVHATDAVTISLQQLTAKGRWPIALAGDDFAPQRTAYQKAVAHALAEDAKGDLSEQTIQAVRDAATALHTKLVASPPDDRIARSDAENYIKTLMGMALMLDRPQVGEILAELKKTKGTTLGSLLAFMHNYNLRFGVAQTPEARAVYQNLYPTLVAARDKVTKEAAGAGDELASSGKNSPTDFFQGMHLDHLAGKQKDDGNSP